MQELDYQDLLKNIGIKNGDILDIASDLVSVFSYCKKHRLMFDANHLLDALQEFVGEEGTIMIRAFSWDFCNGDIFDIYNSPSRVGALGNIALKRPDFQRTQHPLYSWLVWGKYQEELCLMENVSAFGNDTPFDFLYKHHGKMVRIGSIEGEALTHLHQGEKWANVPYRKEKEFEGVYIGYDRNETYKKYSMFVRPLNLDVVILSTEEYCPDWKKQNIMSSKMYNNTLSYGSYDIRGIVDYVIKDFEENAGKKIVSINGKKGIDHFNDWDLLDFGIAPKK